MPNTETLDFLNHNRIRNKAAKALALGGKLLRGSRATINKVEELQVQLALPAPKEEKKGFLNWLFGKIES